MLDCGNGTYTDGARLVKALLERTLVHLRVIVMHSLIIRPISNGEEAS